MPQGFGFQLRVIDEFLLWGQFATEQSGPMPTDVRYALIATELSGHREMS